MRATVRPVVPSALALLLVLVFVACGGGDDEVDIVGDAPDEAADEIATATCERRVDCGNWEIELVLDEESNVVDCIPMLVDVDYDACVSENRADIREDLECAMPTDQELDEIDDCINDLIAQDCIAEEEVDAYCADILAGEEPDEPGEVPPSCDALAVILEGCRSGL